MSIISCTSPRPSETILPASRVTRRPRSSLAARSSSPRRRMNSPRFGAGILRQVLKAASARPIAALASSGVVSRTWAITSPVIGDTAGRPVEAKALSGTPRRARMARASSATEAGAEDTGFRLAVMSGLPGCGLGLIQAHHPRLSLKRNDGGFHATVLMHDREAWELLFPNRVMPICKELAMLPLLSRREHSSVYHATASRRMLLIA